MGTIQILQWIFLAIFGVVFFLATPYAKNNAQFYQAKSLTGKKPGVFLLSSSLIISWIFAKSIVNVAQLGNEFGWVGVLGYACYYLSFIVAGVVIYYLRLKGNFRSIHHFLHTKFGKNTVYVFSIVIAIRLFNEVWSNTMVIGLFFGNPTDFEYYLSIIIFTLFTLMYTLKGGLRSSFITDAIQMVLFGILLIFLLSFIIPDKTVRLNDYVKEGIFDFNHGVDFLIVVILQIFSYPFHDPVLTDRGFISKLSVTIKSYFLAGIIGFVTIFLFGLIGMFLKVKNLNGDVLLQFNKFTGVTGALVMNLIMITSAASTLDSSFSAFAKLIVNDLSKQKITIFKGRLVIVIIATAGTLPIFFHPTILSATTLSGTMVIGLAPVFILWKINVPPISFYLSVFSGLLIGLLVMLDIFPDKMVFTTGKYNNLFAANLWGTVWCFMVFLFPLIFMKNGKIN